MLCYVILPINYIILLHPSWVHAPSIMFHYLILYKLSSLLSGIIASSIIAPSTMHYYSIHHIHFPYFLCIIATPGIIGLCHVLPHASYYYMQYCPVNQLSPLTLLFPPLLRIFCAISFDLLVHLSLIIVPFDMSDCPSYYEVWLHFS